jgi:pimeloyl-ACP methyl ester carboxylesterase
MNSGIGTTTETRGYAPMNDLASVHSPILIIVGDCDFVRVKHALETVKLIPNTEVAVIPSASHFALFSEQERVIPNRETFPGKAREEHSVGNC